MAKPKRKRATREMLEKRVDQVLELITKRRFSDRKIRNALMQSEGISARTANRAIERARQILASIGRQASDEERGLLWERVDELFAAEQNSKNPDRKVLNQILRTQLEVHRTNPNLKGGFVGEPAPAATPSLSAELQKAIERLDLLKPD